MVRRFLQYSMERGRKICVLCMEGGAMKRQNMLVTALDEDGAGFTAMLPGRKKPVHFPLADILTATYARGDKGELE